MNEHYNTNKLVEEIDFWNKLFKLRSIDDEGKNGVRQYEDALKSASELEDFYDGLEQWKSLHRTNNSGDYKDFLTSFDVGEDPQQTIEAAREDLDAQSLVAPSFLIHLIDSYESGKYSREYPIYDVNAWNGYVFLEKDGRDKLYSGASSSTGNYAEYVNWFRGLLEDYKISDPQKLEIAIFELGRVASDLSGKDRKIPKANDNLLRIITE